MPRMDTPEPSNERSQLAPGRGARPVVPHRKRKHSTIDEHVTVLELAAKGISQTEIARVTGISQQAVSTICRKHEPTTSTALGVLKANAHKAAVDWIRSFNVAVKRGEHRPMRDALIATGVVAPDPQAQGITVIVGSGDVSIQPQAQSIGAKVDPDSTHNPTLALPNHDEAL